MLKTTSSDSPERAGIEATRIPPRTDLVSAILQAVTPAGYTAILRGKTGTGIAVVEIYDVESRKQRRALLPLHFSNVTETGIHRKLFFDYR